MEKNYSLLKNNNIKVDDKFKTTDPNTIKYDKKEINKDNILLNYTTGNEKNIINNNIKEESKEEIKINRIIKLRNILKDNSLDKHITYDNLNNLYNLLFNDN